MEFFARLLTALSAWIDDPSTENAAGLRDLFKAPTPEDLSGIEASSDDLISALEGLTAFAETIDNEEVVHLSNFSVGLDEVLAGVLDREKAAKEAVETARLAFAAIRERLAARTATVEEDASSELVSETVATESLEAVESVDTTPILNPVLTPSASVTDAPVSWVMHTKAGNSFAPGAEIPAANVPEALAHGLANLYSTRAGASGERAAVMSIDFAQPVKLGAADLSSPARTTLRLQQILDPQAIVDKPLSASGVCDFERIVAAQALPLPAWQDNGIDDWGIPSIGIEAGIGDGMKIRYRRPVLDSDPTSYSWADPDGNDTTFADQATNANSYPWVHGDDEKTCGLLPCGTDAICEIKADPVCVQYELESSIFNPENFRTVYRAFTVAMARRRSRQIFERVSALAEDRTVPNQGDVGALAYFLTVLNAYRARMISEHRLPQSLKWNISLPSHAQFTFQQDLQWSAGWNAPVVTTQTIVNIFASYGWTLRWRREGAPGDNTELAVGAAGSPIEMLPQTVTAILWHDGAIFDLGGGSMTIGTVVDSQLLRQNRREIWEERWLGTCLFGFAPVKATFDLCANGHNQIERLSADCSTVSLV